MPPPPPTASSNSDTNYQGLTNNEDFEQVESATQVNIISCPYDKTNPVAGRKAAATKDFHDNPTAGIYTFNPNSGLKAAAEARNMTPEEQGKKWLELWTEVAMKVQETGGRCFVIVKSTGPGPKDFVVEGNAQPGEVRRRTNASTVDARTPSQPHHTIEPEQMLQRADEATLPRASLAAQINVAKLAGIPIEYVKY